MNRLKLEASMMETIIAFSEGNPGCIDFLMKSIEKSPAFVIKLLMFADNNDIYGSKLYMLWNDCCDRDLEKVEQTVDYLIKNNISKDKIQENLNQTWAKPFI